MVALEEGVHQDLPVRGGLLLVALDQLRVGRDERFDVVELGVTGVRPVLGHEYQTAALHRVDRHEPE